MLRALFLVLLMGVVFEPQVFAFPATCAVDQTTQDNKGDIFGHMNNSSDTSDQAIKGLGLDDYAFARWGACSTNTCRLLNMLTGIGCLTVSNGDCRALNPDNGAVDFEKIRVYIQNERYDLSKNSDYTAQLEKYVLNNNKLCANVTQGTCSQKIGPAFPGQSEITNFLITSPDEAPSTVGEISSDYTVNLAAYAKFNPNCVDVAQGKCSLPPPAKPLVAVVPEQSSLNVSEQLIFNEIFLGYNAARFSAIKSMAAGDEAEPLMLMAIARGYIVTLASKVLLNDDVNGDYSSGYKACEDYVKAVRGPFTLGASRWPVSSYSLLWGCKIMFAGPRADIVDAATNKVILGGVHDRLAKIKNDLAVVLSTSKEGTNACAAVTDADIKKVCEGGAAVTPFYRCADYETCGCGFREMKCPGFESCSYDCPAQCSSRCGDGVCVDGTCP